MKLTIEQKASVKSCVKDLEYYYQTCGNDLDFENLELLKIYLNSTVSDLVNIDVSAKILIPNDSKK